MQAKKHPSIGCCGIDCGLCPRFHTKGDSACPGCGAGNFREKHPSCGVLTCCVSRHGLEVCAECAAFPCKRFDPEKNGYDSFVTHQRMLHNLGSIHARGMAAFLSQQNRRMEILEEFLSQHDDGRSKNLFCLGCTLLPLDRLEGIRREIRKDAKPGGVRENNKHLRRILTRAAEDLGMELRLRRPPAAR